MANCLNGIRIKRISQNDTLSLERCSYSVFRGEKTINVLNLKDAFNVRGEGRKRNEGVASLI